MNVCIYCILGNMTSRGTEFWLFGGLGLNMSQKAKIREQLTSGQKIYVYLARSLVLSRSRVTKPRSLSTHTVSAGVKRHYVNPLFVDRGLASRFLCLTVLSLQSGRAIGSWPSLVSHKNALQQS